MAWLSNDDSKRIRDGEDESALKRLSQVLSSINRVEDADPEEVEARIRNLSHGTNRDSG
jgi:Asp-tRNA(Asn)/Glu-tRNA(Gln) amidotransferase C subunit